MAKGLDYLINLKDGNFSGAKNAKSELQGLDNAVDRSGKGMSGLGSIVRSVGGLIAASFAVSEVFAFGNASVAAYKEVEMASAQAQAGIVSTNGAAGRSMDQLITKANDLENTTLFGDDQVINAQSLLLTFTKVKGAVFDQAIPAIADMAQRLAGDGPADLKGASIQVGKALNDPIRGITALSKAGVSFSESQKKTIESMVAHNNLAGAQALILGELNTEFGGSAKAARDAAGGKADLTVAIGNLQEGFGELLTGGLNPFYSGMTSLVELAQKGVNWIGANKDLVKTLGIELGIAAGSYMVISTSLGIYTAYQTAAAAATGGLTMAQWAWNAAMTANPLGLVITGVGVLIGGLTIAYKRSENFRAGLNGLIEVGGVLGSVFMGVGKTILGALSFNKDLFLEGVRDSVKVAQEIAGGGIGKAFNKGFDASIAETRLNEKQSAMDKLASNKNTGLPKSATSLSGGSGESTTLSTNRQVRNVNVTIGKLVESLTVSTTNLQGTSAGDMKRMITEILTGAVHDSELALSSN
ncbi:MAG: hypothetical protein Q8S11_15035 [Daejeonella sp.]|uniref:hypothetical protein n=1 Tax=Daejeonella sp. TaxID=2805397 RepID=UPI0027359E00|nr:hypothetical protein [Daejeonella sp.]MDP3469653.1 hypothetical protein [Daejeonella sp.]